MQKKVRQRQQEADRDNSRLVKKLAKLQKDKEKCDAERFANVDQFMAGTLDKDVYQSRRADLTRRAERLDAEIAELEERLHEAEVVQDDGTQDALETLDKFSGATELDQKMVQALVDKVVVYDPRHVEICWKFSDEVLRLLQE
jgi:DNA repair exonuclease SbcCD ATPase subunit